MLSYYDHVILSRDNKFAQRRGDVGRKLDKRRKLRDPDVYYDDYNYDEINDRTNAFGYEDYNDRFRDILDKHYDKTKNHVDDYYDYEDYSYNHFFQKTFLPQINNKKNKNKPSNYFDSRSKNGPKKDKAEKLPGTFKLEDKRKKPSSIKNERIENRRYDKLEVI